MVSSYSVNRECDPPCHRDAECTDTLDFTGNFTCQCKYGYEGDGTSCQGKLYLNNDYSNVFNNLNVVSGALALWKISVIVTKVASWQANTFTL